MRYTCLGRGSGLRVASLCLGTALFGQRWGYGSPAQEAIRILDAYAGAGGNFIDTADSYQDGEAEEILGSALAGRRERFILATKYSLGSSIRHDPTRVGNSRRTMLRSVEESLGRLHTDRIDLLWVHMPDGLTATDEIMRGLDDLVHSGKVLYIGLSDFPAWRVARAATLAELRGWAPVTAIQLEYSLAERTGERELLPMARAMGLGVTAWSPLAGGLLTGKYRRDAAGRAADFGTMVHREDSAGKSAALDMLDQLSKARGATPDQVALAWIMQQGHVAVIGPRTLAQLRGNLGADEVELTVDEMRLLTQSSLPSLGFPHDFLAAEGQQDRLASRLFGGRSESNVA